MDKFETWLNQMKQLSDTERMKIVKENIPKCTYPSCPSYNICATEQNELLFCSLGESLNCITKEKGCFCPECPITVQMGLKYKYFCTRDSEKNQRNMKKDLIY